MFINVSNHPSAHWGADQYQAAAQYGEIVDLPFPAIDPQWDRAAVIRLAEDYYTRIRALAQNAPGAAVNASTQAESAASYDITPQDRPGAAHTPSPKDTTVMVSGEFTFTYHLVALLLQSGYHPVSACTRRESVEQTLPDGSVVKTARFVFVQFREY